MKVLISGNIASIGYNLCKGLRTNGIDADLVYECSSNVVEGTEEDWITIYNPIEAESPNPNLDNKNYKQDRIKKYVLNTVPRIKNRIRYLTLPGIDLEKYDIFHLNYLGNDLNVGIALKHLLKDWSKPVLLYILGTTTPLYGLSKKYRAQNIFPGHTEFSWKSFSTRNRIRRKIKSYLILKRMNVILYGAQMSGKFDEIDIEKDFLPAPVNTDQFKPMKLKQYTNRILCWVKLEKMKGIEIIFKTAIYLPEYQFDIPHVSYSSSVAKYYDKIKPGNVNYIPSVAHEKAQYIINKYPLVLGQFVVGSFGMSELEAMACEKPVVNYYDRKYDKSYGERCPILSSKNPKEIAKLIKLHINDETLGKLSRKWVVKHHSLKNITNKLIKTYKRVLQ